MLEELGIEVTSLGDSNETDDDLSNSEAATPLQKSTKYRPISKHEVVFVDSKGIVKQTSSKHSAAVLSQLNQQRISNQFCDVTLLIEGEAFKAHKSVLAASSEYFRELFIEKGAVASHEAVVDLSGFSKVSFLPLLEFAYTSVLTFDFCTMADVAMLARHLCMMEILEICEYIHKQMEEKKLTVYQKGDVHTVEAREVLPEENNNQVALLVNNEEAPYTVAVSEGVIVTVNGETPTVGESTLADAAVPPSETVNSDTSQYEPVSPAVTDVSPEPVTVTEQKQTEGTDVKLSAPEKGDEAFISVAEEHSAEEMDCSLAHAPAENDKNNEALVAEPDTEKLQNTSKRKRGRPVRLLSTTIPSCDIEENADDQYKNRLRQRSLGEGGYIRLHKGTERKLQNKKNANKSALQQVAMKLVQRGKKMKQPKREIPDSKDVEPEHKCHECGLVFPRRYTLIMHSLKHERSKDYKCPLCKKEFQYGTSLRAHLARHTWKNEVASAAASITESGDAAIKGRTKREFICDICGKSLPKLYSLRIHMLKHTGVKPHACKVCGKAFTYKRGLKMHMALHEAQKQFRCGLCEKSFVTKRSLQEHLSIHTGESKYLCSICGKSFHRASALSKHTKKHQPKPEVRQFQCAHCEKSFYEARDLRQHMNKHLSVKPFQCQLCGKCYSWKKDWYSHVKSHSVTEPFKCNVCGKEFFEKALYRRHVKKATHGKKGRAKQNLERTCGQCGRKFTQLREYRRHMNNHEGVKPFECLTCGVAWADARSLKRHVRTHTGERPYVCPECSEAYIDARTLRKHMTKFHRDYVPGKIMLEKDTLQFHNQGTQVEHAVSIIATNMQEQDDEMTVEEIEAVVVSGETFEAVETVAATEECNTVSTLSDQGIMQVVNYVLAQQHGPKPDTPETIETVEVEVAIPEAE
ncbi:zinc finger and BTB domain-containing protein 11 isoform X2 [Protopterus annectens]|nr:zinc finger and BTB domain-containing protein 11 isoform X2 [Protopterus annectens]